VPKLILAYSGGLDTTTAIKWLTVEQGYEVIALNIDVGRSKEQPVVESRGMAAGAPAVSTELANDGAPFSGKQIGLTWLAQRTVLMCLKPRGAAHHGVRVELSDPPRVDDEVKC